LQIDNKFSSVVETFRENGFVCRAFVINFPWEGVGGKFSGPLAKNVFSKKGP